MCEPTKKVFLLLNMTKNIFYSFFLFSFFCLQSQGQSSSKLIAMDTSASCFSHENKQKIFSALKEVILKNRISEIHYDGYSINNFIYNNLSFKYELVPNMELVSVYDRKEKLICYNIINEKQKVFVEVRNHPSPMSVSTQEKAEQHFCQVISKMDFNITSSFKDTAHVAPRHLIQLLNFNNKKVEKEAIQFIDYSLKKNGNFGGEGDFSEGIIEIFEFYDMTLSNEKEYYGLSLQTNNGYLASMRIDKKNHTISNSQFGHRN